MNLENPSDWNHELKKACGPHYSHWYLFWVTRGLALPNARFRHQLRSGNKDNWKIRKKLWFRYFYLSKSITYSKHRQIHYPTDTLTMNCSKFSSLVANAHLTSIDNTIGLFIFFSLPLLCVWEKHWNFLMISVVYLATWTKTLQSFSSMLD